ncbi:MAG: sigma-54-dependent Fis family transcriptional regulator [Candidatus Jettenia sp.]|uniref:Two-component response regulator n=1 Tax=Candidatus Jettenia caeni TaxID=247490 RepID=I3IL97_9BACT|nr:sigma-54-dependent Fis family transcriptional regulator [Candidatus Jettenia sp. AMX1]MBC6927636.1 sigma-54-dependent Fis family transcriptional regulator [Candidatus Jettenia sp.]NUN22046.1 sigma-54-dependent Fis family transcriptional regulator [Candidatus Jettenia caeni]KAA0250092.1 MAG: sigma-54-dependent Fis family transcriptional regulator [Candidatus Jettenia sp. AMX1]MCE7880175.1 sigma-54-dependent Fis family transcriptional regulator [Candidatus Jettenia sp. AMX1]MCQ3926615.1 sigma
MRTRILIIDDEENIRFTLKSFLLDWGYEVVIAKDYHEALAMIDASDFDLIFADIFLEGKTGIDFLREVKNRNMNSPVIMITGVPNIETASDALRLGAFDYISKPILKDTLLRVTKMALQHKALVDEKENYRLNLKAIFNSVKDAIITVDQKLHVLEINEAAKDVCNLSREVIGVPLGSLPKHCSGQCLVSIEETIHKKQPAEVYHIECRHKFRPQQIVSITTYPLLSNKGIFSGVVLVVSDETYLADLARDKKECKQFHTIVGKSEKMQTVYSLIESLSNIQTTVLITGESGTGKGLVAEALHLKGERSHKPFINVNCAALSQNLLESELFGHVKGAFTGAVQDRIGRFQKADGGTIFLDEIGDISPRMQLQLLRVLQEKEFEKVGDSTPIRIDVRIVAATNQNLKEKIRQRKFREDLYYRLKVVEVNLPPLRDRREDIPLLVNHFLNKLNKKINKEIVAISSDVQKIFMEYQWPGNVRELEHTLEHAFILCPQSTITVDYLPGILKGLVEVKTTSGEDITIEESQAILQALEKTAWSRVKAARLLGMSRSTFYRKIEEYKIKMRDI